MKNSWIYRGVIALAMLAVGLFAAPDADAGKEKFVRDKIHISPAAADDDAAVVADEKKDEKKARKRAKKKKAKRSGDEIAKKTDKSETARAK